jgi:hypothetical protein
MVKAGYGAGAATWPYHAGRLREVPVDTLVLTATAFADWATMPFGPEANGGATGGVAAIVDCADPANDVPPAVLARAVRAVPGVIVGVMPSDPSPAASALSAAMDVVLSAGEPADRIGVAAERGVDAEVELLVAAAASRPRAAAALALLLRGAEERPVADGLVAESAVYSMLQAGPEFAAWRAGRPAPAPGSETGRRDPVEVVRDGERLTITLSRPAVHNAFNTAMRDALVEALAAGAADPSLTVVLTGAGPSFCSGGDLSEFGTTPDPATAHLVRLTRSPAALAAQLGQRLEARVHGACLGAGVELSAFAGRVVAHPDAFFALPELALGLIPGAGGTVSLPRRIGRHRTAWLALTGERIGAARARQWGLVDEIA